MMDNNEVLVSVEGVSKKFAKDLKKSLIYGLQDIGRELIGRSRQTKLRDSEFWAVRDVSFDLKRGECLGLIGHNGAGKSTLLKILNGLIKPDAGRIVMKGRVAALIELGAGFNPILTGRENIYNNASVLGFSKEETDAKLDEIIEFSELGDFIDTPVRNYSSGMKVRLGFSVAAQLEPDVLIIDEVLAVGDVGFRAKCLNRINDLMANAAVIFVSHSMTQVARICTDIALLEKGRIKYNGKDVTNGVEMFMGGFNSEEAKLLGAQDAIEILDLKLLQEDKNVEGVYKQHTEFVLKVRAKAKLDYEKYVLTFSFFDRELKGVACAQSDVCGFYAIPDGNGVMEFEAKFLNVLAPGNFVFNLAFSGLKEEQSVPVFLCNFQAIKKVQVVGSSFVSHNPVHIPTEWFG